MTQRDCDEVQFDGRLFLFPPPVWHSQRNLTVRFAGLCLTLGAIFCGAALAVCAIMPSNPTPSHSWWMGTLGWSFLGVGLACSLIAFCKYIAVTLHARNSLEAGK